MTPEEKKALVEGKVDAFETFFRRLGNEPLARSERAIVSTYIAWELGLAKEQEENAEEGCS